MKKKRTPAKRTLALLLTLALVAALIPASVLAQTVTFSPSSDSSNSTVEVEYFTANLYNWDQDAANEATVEAGKTTTTEETYTSTSVSYSDFTGYTTSTSGSGWNQTTTYTGITAGTTGYYYLADGAYYAIYYNTTVTTSGNGWNQTVTATYTFYYTNSSGTQVTIATGTSGTLSCYSKSEGAPPTRATVFTSPATPAAWA